MITAASMTKNMGAATRAIQPMSRLVRPWMTNRFSPTGGVICAISTTSTMKMPNQIKS